jgi:phosphatidylglycerophosphate synthase
MTFKSAALVLADAGQFLGMDLTVRAALTASRAGIERIHIAGEHPQAVRIQKQLRQLGLNVTWTADKFMPFKLAPIADFIIVLDARTIVEPAALTQLLDEASSNKGEAVMVVDTRLSTPRRFVKISNGYVQSIAANGQAAETGLAAIPGEAAFRIRAAVSVRDAMQALARAGVLQSTTSATKFCRRIDNCHEIPRLEHEYLSRTSGGKQEGFFTRHVRRYSIPVSRQLLRTPISANQVTLAGFGFALLGGLAFSLGSYWMGVLGALLYAFSTVLDCSDGEVARGSLSSSPYGAWLETITDYLSYFVVLGGIVLGDVRSHGFCIHAKASIVAAAASLAIVSLVGYLRHRVASQNPGALDDALAAELKKGTPVQRFTGWSRQLIKRSFFTHLVVFQAVIGHLPALTEIWAYGAVAGLGLVLAVQAHLIQRVRVAPLSHTTALLEN